ncbi:sugar transferase [Sphingomonas baiyangensis]|uniref:Sugar transferase n=1 Tax=Sphingomonas baiyangensis TaxID=2572576 RepID=A0A4V5PW84_9SPHN|nr:sugar transferase [Sphingomonas baiyangensis]TKD50008.1 sugar transferase [Sphingomonas baiyangensis]
MLMQSVRAAEAVPRRSALQSSSFQLLLLLVAGVLVPAALMLLSEGTRILDEVQWRVSTTGSTVAILFGAFLVRKVTAYPGVGAFGMLIPSFGSAYALVIATMFATRVPYSGWFLGLSIAATMTAAFLLFLLRNRLERPRFYVVVAGQTQLLFDVPGVEWVALDRPVLPDDRHAAFVADLRHDHDDAWERMLAEAAIEGRPVYHTKQLWESLTGRVSIEHMSENSLGSLLPNLAYRRVKRLTDIVGALVLLPVLALPMAVLGLAIRLDSAGPALFRQERMGFRGQSFTMVKFRTMRVRDAITCDNAARDDAITLHDDDRVTRLGRFLRASRLDELPQILNVLAGDMSFIGPRPEAVPLSRWYEVEIPFYRYRHIVRPGITGWAQVKQGHVHALDDVDCKLSYDFFYVKNFSLWLDILIALRTIPTMLSGFGAR